MFTATSNSKLNTPPALYKSFFEITSASLQHALAEHEVSLSEHDTAKLLKAYDSLGTFPDVEPGLKSLADDPAIDAYVFSNGTDAMVSSSVTQSPSLSPHAGVFKSLITVQEIGIFKPDMKVYQYLAKKVGQENNKERVWLVSGNPFDVVGARVAGLQAAWVDRAGGHGKTGWNDKLGELCGVGPTVIANGVEDAVNAIKQCTSQHRTS